MLERTFKPSWEIIDDLFHVVSMETIRDEPMFHKADPRFVLENGGDLSKWILQSLPKEALNPPDGYYSLIDSRVTNTMKGFYPSIPGWHGDNVPRGTKYSQPDLDKVDPNCQHYMCNIATSKNVTNTEYLASELSVEYDPERVWASIDEFLTQKERREGCWFNLPNLSTVKILPGQIVRFAQDDLHRATPCIEPGWRLFFRVSITKRKPLNEIRNQVQVYIVGSPGW